MASKQKLTSLLLVDMPSKTVATSSSVSWSSRNTEHLPISNTVQQAESPATHHTTGTQTDSSDPPMDGGHTQKQKVDDAESSLIVIIQPKSSIQSSIDVHHTVSENADFTEISTTAVKRMKIYHNDTTDKTLFGSTLNPTRVY